MASESWGGKLAELARRDGVSLREFLLEHLNAHKNLTSLAREFGVTPQRVRIDMSRANVVEIRRYYEPDGGGGIQSVVGYIPIEAVSPPFLPVIPTK